MQSYNDKMTRPIQQKLGISLQAMKWRKVEKEKQIVLGNSKEVKSAIPPRIRRWVTLELSTLWVFKANTHTIVTTTLHEEESNDYVIIAPSYHISIREANEEGILLDEENIKDAPQIVEEGGQAIIDELELINPRSKRIIGHYSSVQTYPMKK